MMPLTSGEIAELTGGELLSGSTKQSHGISIDSRDTQIGDLFVAFAGCRTDGHRFVEEAAGRGATNILVSKSVDKYPDNTGVIMVNNCAEGLKKIAAFIRSRSKAKVVAITGSTGKTTTKDILFALLTDDFKTIRSEKSFNNEIGLPLAISKSDSDTEIMLLEMGMRGEGQIKALCDISSPHYGVITNIGKSHLELLKSEENIAKAKTELAESLPANGALFLNSDNKWLDYIKSRTKAEVFIFGKDKNADVRFEIIESSAASSTFNIISDGKKCKIELKLPGEHNVINAVSAVAVALKLGVDIKKLPGRIKDVELSPQRTDIKTSNGIIIIDDSYNANPDSMKAALDLLQNYGQRKIAVLGDMLELGENSAVLHKEIGEYARKTGLDILLTVGEKSQDIYEGFGQASNLTHYHCESASEAAEEINSIAKRGDVVLIKGSRLLGMERVAEALERVENC